MEKLPLETQTLYAEFMEQLLAMEAHRSIGRISGCFTTKIVKGETYYYFQYSEPGGVPRQVYVGKKIPALDRVVKRFLTDREAFKVDIQHIQRLCAQLRMGGALITDTASARVLKAFAESGVFHLNGVLVGTHAFTVLGNLLGVRWTSSAAKTQDVDIASELRLSIAVPNIQADVPQILEGLEMGFLPVPPLNPKNPSTSFKVRGKPLRVDILTPEISANDRNPVFISRFNVAAQPIRFLDYLIENPEQGAVVNGGGILLKVPTPARFAFHKLIASRERGVTMHDKVEKDIMQAAQVFSVLADERPGDLLLAWDEIERRGEGWVKRVAAGLSVMRERHRVEHEMVHRALPELKAVLLRHGGRNGNR
ncbi:MAG: hypothetical protein JRJ50_11915 [Deltaproteobacteria bacterium]|nr:hypothetical protein [Deltaproteobacteria bacterium]MBW2116019.1 hypothetical protein [Deltaproteobacteria bacterium]